MLNEAIPSKNLTHYIITLCHTTSTLHIQGSQRTVWVEKEFPILKAVLNHHRNHGTKKINDAYNHILGNTKEELIDELLTVNSIHEGLIANLTSRFDEFLEKYARVEFELAVSKNCTKLLSKQIETLQINALDSSQYLRREMIEINPVPEDIQDMQLEESICQALKLS